MTAFYTSLSILILAFAPLAAQSATGKVIHIGYDVGTGFATGFTLDKSGIGPHTEYEFATSSEHMKENLQYWKLHGIQVEVNDANSDGVLTPPADSIVEA